MHVYKLFEVFYLTLQYSERHKFESRYGPSLFLQLTAFYRFLLWYVDIFFFGHFFFCYFQRFFILLKLFLDVRLLIFSRLCIIIVVIGKFWKIHDGIIAWFFQKVLRILFVDIFSMSYWFQSFPLAHLLRSSTCIWHKIELFLLYRLSIHYLLKIIIILTLK